MGAAQYVEVWVTVKETQNDREFIRQVRKLVPVSATMESLGQTLASDGGITKKAEIKSLVNDGE
jgi:hypothetical protein